MPSQYLQYVQYIVPLLVIALVAWRMSRSMKGRPVKRRRLWIRPVLIAVFMALALATTPGWGSW
jgi:membrane-anchored protein YejM (alkaline phosphatase superfamily)